MEITWGTEKEPSKSFSMMWGVGGQLGFPEEVYTLGVLYTLELRILENSES